VSLPRHFSITVTQPCEFLPRRIASVLRVTLTIKFGFAFGSEELFNFPVNLTP
jgi:hypothetical protein